MPSAAPADVFIMLDVRLMLREEEASFIPPAEPVLFTILDIRVLLVAEDRDIP